MICPKCQERGLKSIIHVGHTMTTLMGYFGYYDEEGNYHHHDRNRKTTDYNCSNGHKFIGIKHGTPCPSYPNNCDFDGGEEELKFIEENHPLDKE